MTTPDETSPANGVPERPTRPAVRMLVEIIEAEYPELLRAAMAKQLIEGLSPYLQQLVLTQLMTPKVEDEPE